MKNIRLDLTGSVAVITLNRPSSANRLDRDTARELEDACRSLGHEKDIRAVLLTGSGSDFCGGIEACGEATELREAVASANAAIAAVAALEMPVIAAINGLARGVGLALALACDLRIASDKTVVCSDDSLNRGLLVGGISQRLPRLAGRGKGLEMLLTGEAVGAEEARRCGLVSLVVPAGELQASVTRLAQKLAARAPIAERYAKEAVLKGMDMTLEQGLRLECDLYMIIQTTRDRVEGVRSFLEKRAPEFRGE